VDHLTKHDLPEKPIEAYALAPGQVPCFWCWGVGTCVISEDRKEVCDFCHGTGVRVGRC
jgi:hypothetical protein